MNDLHFRHLVNNALIGIIDSTLNGEIIYANQAAARMADFDSPEKLQQQGAFFLWHDPQLRKEFISQLEQHGFVDSYEMDSVTRAGRNIRLLWSATLSGDVISSMVVDITAHKKAESELSLSSEIITEMIEGVYVFRSEDGIIIFTSPSFESAFGYASDEMIGQHISIINAPADRGPEEKVAEINAALDKTGKWEGEVINRRKDGTSFWCYANIRGFNHPEHGNVWVSIHTDITEKKKADEDKEFLLEDLGRRLKALQCMYKISNSISTKETIDEIFQDAAAAIPPGWNYPEITRCKVRYETREWVSESFKETEWKQSSDIVAAGNICGSVEVYYLEERPALDEGPFMTEERNLIDNISRSLSQAIERKLAKNALADSEARFRMIYEFAPVMIDAFDSSGRCTMWNKECEKVFGWTSEEIFSHENPLELLYPDPEIQQQVIDTVTSTPRPVFREWRPIRKDGSETVCLWANFELPDGSIISLGHDITERRQTEAALQESRALVDGYFTVAPVAMGFFDTNMHYVKLNKELADISGLSIEDHINKHPCDVMPAVLGMKVEEELETVARTHRVNENVELSCETPGQPSVTRHFVQSYFPILKADQSPLGIGMTSIETTGIKRIEEQLRQSQKMEALGTLAGGIAHDFNNILYPIFINANLLLRKFETDSEEFEISKDIIDSATRAKDLVSQILLFGRRRSANRSACNIVPVVKEAVTLMRAAIPTTIVIKENYATDLVPVICDSSQIYQVLVNLCTNAGQAITNVGQVEITLEAREFNGLECFDGTKIFGRYARLTVTDDGVGMDTATLSNIFDPFFTTKDTALATGLGLSTTFGIVENHAGGIVVSTQLGEGTTFEVLLPLADEVNDSRDDSADSVGDYYGTEKILFVDDQAAITKIGKKYLEQFGYSVTIASDGRKALDIFTEDPDFFDLVITDQTMPKIRGDILARDLLKLRPDLSIILCTGYSSTIFPEDIKLLGISAFLNKPIDPGKLGRVVREVLNKARDSKQE